MRSRGSWASATGGRGPSSTQTNAARSGRSDWSRSEIGNLATETECIIGAPGSEVLIGQIVEALDLIADCRNRTLTPRHPEGPVLALR